MMTSWQRSPILQTVLSGTIDKKPRLEFLAPLDPLFWDKALIEALWDFRYSWEIYTPVVKRKYGYYTLPVLWGERFIGRIEAVADRNNGVLLVKHFWPESGFRQTKKLNSAICSAVKRLAKLNNCNWIEGWE